MTQKVALDLETIEEVFGKAQMAQAEINTLIENSDELDYQDFDEVMYNLEMIQRRVDPAIWKDYSSE